MELFSDRTILTVSRLTSLVKNLLEDNFEQVWVEGEVSNLSRPASGHIYFSLKDSGATLRCVMFRGSARNMKFTPADGMALILRGRLSLYDQRGEYQLLCEYIEPRGAGALQMAFAQLKERLSAEGLFDQERKRGMPFFPSRVAVVTSSTGAAIHDILKVLSRRSAPVELQLYPVRVQGDGAAEEIAGAVAGLNRIGGFDLIIAGRGGGSLEDLWAFNEEVVARAIFNSSIPVISAVGHETDWTIADFVADMRAPTPSAAAEMVTTALSDLRQMRELLEYRMEKAVSSMLQRYSMTIEGLKRALHDPATMLGHASQRVDDLSARLDMAVENLLERRAGQSASLLQRLDACSPALNIARLRQQILMLDSTAEHRMLACIERFGRESGELSARLDTLSPLKTLSRGYAVAERISDGSVLRDPALLSEGELIRLRLEQGNAVCSVAGRDV